MSERMTMADQPDPDVSRETRPDRTRPVRNINTHECPAPWCTRKIPASLYACREDWYALPKSLRNRIWATVDDLLGPARREAEAACQRYWQDHGPRQQQWRDRGRTR